MNIFDEIITKQQLIFISVMILVHSFGARKSSYADIDLHL